MQKNVLVTGGSRGIGKAIAIALAQSGVKVALTYRVEKTKALSVVEEIKKNGGTALAVQLDQKYQDSIQDAVKMVRKKFGTIDILVNNAGIAQKKSFLEITVNDWEAMLAVNLRGPFFLCQQVLPDMIKAGWGRIVNMGSIGGQWGGKEQVHYAASKAGLINFTRSLAKLYGERGITSNAIAPGLVDTDMLVGLDVQKDLVVNPKEVASAVLFLVSDSAGSINGQTLNINKGMLFS